LRTRRNTSALADGSKRVSPKATEPSPSAGRLCTRSSLRSDDVPDVEIAALAIEHGLVLASHDHGFRRFSRLRVADPLTGEST